MSMELKIIVVVALFLIGSHLLLWGFIKRKLRDAEARIAKEKAEAKPSEDGDQIDTNPS